MDRAEAEAAEAEAEAEAGDNVLGLRRKGWFGDRHTLLPNAPREQRGGLRC